MQALSANFSRQVDARTAPGRSPIIRWFAPLVAALYETRRSQAEREIVRHVHLLGGLPPEDAPSP